MCFASRHVVQAKNKRRRALQARPIYVTITVGIAMSLILIKGKCAPPLLC